MNETWCATPTMGSDEVLQVERIENKQIILNKRVTE